MSATAELFTGLTPIEVTNVEDLFAGPDSAMMSLDELYRHGLSRDCGGECPLVGIGLNPSTADHRKDDNTIRKDKKFTRAWGFGRFIKLNAYDYRSTDPKAMFGAKRNGIRIISARNDLVIREVIDEAIWRKGKVWVAWGKNIEPDRQREMAALLDGAELWCIKTNLDGSPVHELYQPDASVLQRWECP